MESSVRAQGLPEHQQLSQWLQRAARRVQTRDRLRAGGWILCTLLSGFAVYFLLQTLRVPSPVLVALSPLLLLATVGAGAYVAWRWARRPSLTSAAGEADTRGNLKDELKSAYWFARQDARSVWEAAVVRGAAEKIRDLDPRELFPLRIPDSFGIAAALGTIVLALCVIERHATAPVGPALSAVGHLAPEARTALRAQAGEHETAADASATSVAALHAQEAVERWTKPEDVVRSANGTDDRAEAGGTVQARDVKRMQALVEAAEPGGPARPAGSDARDQAGGISAGVAQGILERLQALLAGGDEPSREQPQAADERQDHVPRQGDHEAEETQTRNADRSTTMDALNDALRALSQAATGGERMTNSPPSQASPNRARANINGGAMGMRVNTSEAGEGGEDTPPDTPSEGAEPVLGKPTLRLAAQLQRLSTGSGQNDSPGMGEGFYAATQAQAALVDLAPAQGPQRSAAEAALAREQVPLPYRAAVKRYFLTEHGKEH